MNSFDERLWNIADLVADSDDYRREIITSEHSQVVLMTVEPGDEIGEEVHEDHDQFLAFVEGEGEAILEGRKRRITGGDFVFVPAGTRHNFVNNGDVPIRLVTLYAPPEHEPGTVHPAKADEPPGY